MSLGKKLLKLSVVCLGAFIMFSCEDEETTLIDNLTEGYWMDMSDPAEPMVSFDVNGQLYYYIYAGNSKGGYDAFYDSSVKDHTRYAIDVKNGRLCLLPDQWFDILVLNSSTLTLSRTNSDSTVKYQKIDADDISVMSRNEFYEEHPAR